MHIRRVRTGPRRGRVLFAFVLLIVFALTGAFVARRTMDPHGSFVSQITGMFQPIPSPEALFHKSRLAILVVGLDYNYNDRDEEYSTAARTDTIMALSLDLPTHSLHELSVPRDTAYTYPDGHVDKINSLYAVGGIRASENGVAHFLGIPGFDRYVVLRINATKALIDAMGGIDVPVKETMNYDDSWGHLHIHFHPGLYHMNGEQAVSYSRFRHDACSDPCRIQRQQQVLRLMIAKLTHDKFGDLIHIKQLIDVLDRNVQTDLSPIERLSLASAYANFHLADLQVDQIPYVDDEVLPNAGDVLLPDQAAKAQLVQRLFLTQVAMTPAPTADVAAIQPQQQHLHLQNGTGEIGLGSRIAGRLRHLGFPIDTVDNAANFSYQTTEIHVGASGAALGQRLREALALPEAQIVQDSTQTTDALAGYATIILGRDALPQPATL